jgi:hypothetical protein
MTHSALAIYFAAALREEVFDFDYFVGLQSTFFVVLSHLLTGIGSTITSAILIFILFRRHFDANFLWAYKACSFFMIAIATYGFVSSCIAASYISRSSTYGKASTLGEGVAIACIVLQCLILLYHVRELLFFFLFHLKSYFSQLINSTVSFR